VRPVLLALLALLGVGADAAADTGWRKQTEKDGIYVEARSVHGSRVREVRAVAEIEATPEACYAVVSAFSEYTRTMPYVKESRILRTDDDGRMWTYARVEAPLVSARDYALLVSTTRRAGGEIQMAWVPANTEAPAPRKGVVRVEVNQGAWTFAPLEGGLRTRATYQLLTDPGGSVTTWLADQANKTAVPDVIRAVRKAAKQAK